ncbi:hypothetical protein ETB97_008539 [Aspergillus alliaceus]|uniref:Secreted protein n=1 Tax=Petromyces alliaceus TaxID=209559 RepID=A0A8H6ADZ1_PETAA|nr:hypothetical protein ETB97_008539 [Aspergillus burnettii]
MKLESITAFLLSAAMAGAHYERPQKKAIRSLRWTRSKVVLHLELMRIVVTRVHHLVRMQYAVMDGFRSAARTECIVIAVRISL